MPAPDAKTRTKISLSPRIFSTSIPTKHVPRILLSALFYATSLHAGKGALDFDVGVFWLVMRVLACAGFGALIWEGRTGQLAKRKSIEWSVLGTASLLVFVQQGCLFTALYRLPSTRVVLFTHFSTSWIQSLWNFSAPRKVMAILLAWFICIVSDTGLSSAALLRFLPGYGALFMYSLASAALDHTSGILVPSLGTTFTIAASVLGASVFALPFYVFRTFILNFPETPVVPLASLAAIPFIAFSLLLYVPITSKSLSNFSLAPQHFTLSYPSTVMMTALLGSLAFSQFPTWTDAAVAVLLFLGMQPESADTFPAPSRTPTSRLMRSYFKTILSNPESRKIFYFLVLNMAFMLVQMLYGVWTNSLGLISDAIHMAFDCMAIGVGLFASIMAKWEPNERFTYGYGRIETLSGFANGIFLILISVFIIFEAVQRILEPPEMNTSQLLLVSSLGLAVNLFGMFAMGGHHHGHSHSHGHGHSHGESHGSHDHQMSAKDGHAGGHSHEDHGHSHDNPTHSHTVGHPSDGHQPSHVGNGHSHGHSHEQEHSHESGHTHESGHSHEQAHSHSHSHDVQEHSHEHSHGHSHAHSHASGNAHQAHSHSPPTSPTSPHVHPHLPPNAEQHSHPDSHSAVASHDRKRQFSGTPLHVHSSMPNSPFAAESATPITPKYRFGVDEHYQTHHEDEHRPNVHNPAPPSSHEGHSHNMRGVFLHVMADTLGSVGVILSTLLIQFYGWTGFDPIASLFIAVLIAASVFPLVIDTGRVLCLDITDRQATIDQALSELQSIEGLASFNAPRFWPKDDTSLIGSIHIRVAPSAASFDPAGPHSNQRTTYHKLDRVVERVDSLLRRRISGLEELTIQIEEYR